MRLKQGIVRLLKAMGLHTLQANVRFLARHDISYLPFERIHGLLDLAMLEKEGALPQLPSAEETLEHLIHSEANLSRFGDGEFLIVDGRPNLFQRADVKLQHHLKEILASEENNVLVGLTQDMFMRTSSTPENARHYGRCFLAYHRHAILSSLQSRRPYENGSVTMPGFHFTPLSMSEYFDRFRSLWQNRHLVLIQGSSLLSQYAFNVFDTAEKITIIDAPRRNAFDRYDELMERALSFPDDVLFALCLGSTATVMAYDLSCEGRRALDLGHLPKAYDHFKRGLSFDDWAAGVRFFTED